MSLGAVVLAGGESRRMGADKATLDWHGRPLVVHVAETVRAAVEGPVVVVGAPGRALPPLPPGVETATDASPGRGPLEGLAAGLAAIGDRAEAAFVCATDMPFVDAGLIERLRAQLDPEYDAVTMVEEGRPLPLGTIYRTRLAELALSRAGGDDRSLRGLLGAVRTRLVEGETARLRSLDTRAAYEAALDEA